MFRSDKLQEFKQKHQELKAAVAKELGFKLLNSEAMDGREKNSDQETGCGKEGEEEGNSTMTESSVESAAVVSVNGSDVEPEQNQAEGSDRAAPDTKTVNGVPEAGATGEESKNFKENATADEARSDEINGEMNGALDTVTSPSGLKGKGTWADIVSNATLASGTGDKVTNVKKVAGHITANGVAEE